MPYYAHIRQDENGQTIYQTVAEHLTGTAALCREFAADFGAEADGDLMGLAHAFWIHYNGRPSEVPPTR